MVLLNGEQDTQWYGECHVDKLRITQELVGEDTANSRAHNEQGSLSQDTCHSNWAME